MIIMNNTPPPDAGIIMSLKDDWDMPYTLNESDDG